MKKTKQPKKVIKLRKKPVLGRNQKAQLRKIMKTVRLIKIWNLQHPKS